MCSRLLFCRKCTGFTVCFNYSDISLGMYTNQCLVNIEFTFTCDILLSFSLKSGFFWAILKDFEFAIYCSLLRRKREESLFWKGSSAIFPPKSHRSAFKLCRKKVERYTLLFVPHDRKSIQKARSYIASPRRKLKSHSFWTVKMRRRIHTCKWQIVLLIASFLIFYFIFIIRNSKQRTQNSSKSL